MALSSVLRSESAEFADRFNQPFAQGCGFNQIDLGFGSALDDSLNFAVKPLGEGEEPERKIEFLHGTTTLAFKVSSFSQRLIAAGQLKNGFSPLQLKCSYQNNCDMKKLVSFIIRLLCL